MRPRNLCTAVFAATTLLFTAGAHADVYGDDCRRNPPRISADCNDDLDPNPRRLISREQAQAIVDAVKAKRAAAQAKAAQDAIAANRCGTGQVLVGGSCQDFKAAIADGQAPACAFNEVLSGDRCVPLPQVSPQCEPASRTTRTDTFSSQTWGTQTIVLEEYECGTPKNSKTCSSRVTTYPAQVTEVISFGSCQGSPLVTAEYAGGNRNWYFTKSFVSHCPTGMEAKDVLSGAMQDTVLTYCVTK